MGSISAVSKNTIDFFDGPFGSTTVKMPVVGPNSPKSVILDSGASISVAPASFFSKVVLDTSCNNEYKLQDASGSALKIHGTRQVPFKLGRATVNILFVICDVVMPLLSTNDLLSAGVSVTLKKEGSFCSYNNRDYPLEVDGTHHKLQMRYKANETINFVPQLKFHNTTSGMITNSPSDSIKNQSALRRVPPCVNGGHPNKTEFFNTNSVSLQEPHELQKKYTQSDTHPSESNISYDRSVFGTKNTQLVENIGPVGMGEVVHGPYNNNSTKNPILAVGRMVPVDDVLVDIPLETLHVHPKPQALVSLRPGA